MVIYLDQYRAGRTAAANRSRTGTYGDELLSADSQNLVAVLTLPDMTTAQFPDDFAKVDLEIILDHIYALATQV